jgi:hypothetical protein
MSEIGVAAMGLAAADAKSHLAVLLEPRRAPVYEARGSEPRNEPTAIDERHIAYGNVNTSKQTSERRATGHHLENSTESSRIVKGTRSSEDRNGVYTAHVEIRDSKSGLWVSKKEVSTFFPKHFSIADIRRAIGEAFANATPRSDGYWEGTTARGMRLKLGVDESRRVRTAYPIFEGKP